MSDNFIPEDFPQAQDDAPWQVYDAYVACDVLVSYYTQRCCGHDNAFLQAEYSRVLCTRRRWSDEQVLWVFREVAEILGLRWPAPPAKRRATDGD